MPDHYGTVAGADSYHAARGNAGWAGTDEVKTAALVRASQYVDGLAGTTTPSGCTYYWPGVKSGGRAQRQAWPRRDAFDADGNPLADDEVPAEVVEATYEAALRELTSPGSLNPDFQPGQVVKREKVDVLETTYAVSDNAGADALRPVFGAVDALLAPVLHCRRSGGFAMAVV